MRTTQCAVEDIGKVRNSNAECGTLESDNMRNSEQNKKSVNDWVSGSFFSQIFTERTFSEVYLIVPHRKWLSAERGKLEQSVSET